ncbi:MULTISPECIES: hypothetical protein [unclassified Nostoc]|uniref:hypothetical protein n=1 Tax=unclassified Nostoc TaxID=2593658 RepID=UPI002AD29BEE|nr:hypothetical protein [Nostoc sp. DedQUE03]MDZ7975701.1 hypothetical protein [Nostoc sp. DedQUE03]MDZ8048804.1 hypothetical protein [Nostoc sp. DedQUE02]
MTLFVCVEPIGKKMNRLLIESNGIFIGEYEKSQQADIDRKIEEINAAETTLLSIYEKYGEFCVRWDGKARKKSIRIKDIEVGSIPKAAWRPASWQK